MNEQIPFDIIVGDSSGEITNGDIPVRWCITPELITQMERDGIIDPHIFIVTNKNFTVMQRQLIPLSELMTYARFTKSGDCYIHACIVDGKKGRKYLHDKFIRRGHDLFLHDPLQWENFTELLTSEDVPEFYASVSHKVHIPSGVFGKEPSAFIKWFANLWHEKKTVDECHFRRRLIFAFTLKIFPVLFWTILSISVRLLSALLLSAAGFRSNVESWKNIFKPWDTTYDMTVDLNMHLSEQEYLIPGKPIPYVTMFFLTPIIPILLFFMYMLINSGNIGFSAIDTLLVLLINLKAGLIIDSIHLLLLAVSSSIKKLDLWIGQSGNGPLFAFTLLINVALILIGGILLSVWMYPIPSLLVAMLIGGMYYILHLYNKRYEHNNYSEIRELLCPNDLQNLNPNYNNIPKEQRTIRLWYLKTKNKMCKPMQN